MNLKNVKIGYALTGSFCTLKEAMNALSSLAEKEADILPIVSENVANTDTRFGKAQYFLDEISRMTGKDVIKTVKQAEPIGPSKLLDVLVIAPCTGNTLAKLANAITDTPVTMAAKAHLRNGRPLVLAISTNDGLSASAVNWARLINSKNVFFVPFGQDDPINKPTSLVADLGQLEQTVSCALERKQLQPLVKSLS